MSDDLPRLVYLVILLGAVAGYFIVENRGRMGKNLQQAAIWGLIFLGAVAGYGLWNDVSRDLTGRGAIAADGTLSLPRAPDGHYYIAADVNGERIRFVVDTGASDIVLSSADADRLGFSPDTLAYTGRAMTANGSVQTAPVVLGEVVLGRFTDTDIPAVVNSGELDMSLLGMSYLNRFHITISGETMELSR